METVFFFKNMMSSEEEKLREYFAKKLPSLEKLLSHFPPDGVMLHVKGEKFKKHSAYEVELIMKMPGETLTAREASHQITKAVDLSHDRLEMQIKKSVTQVRRQHRNIKARSKLKMETHVVTENFQTLWVA
ncbi:MAG: HPF/RaiA family ribosome-associated protein [Patescibacteria group bacterium]